jgi:pyrroline-5-carboxylate reductase
LKSYELGIIGCGNMGEALLKGILKSGVLKCSEIIFYDKDSSRREYIVRTYKIHSAGGSIEVSGESKYILLAVKPQNIKTVLEEIKDGFDCKNSTIISIIAGVPTVYIEKKLNSNVPIIRIMPNTPALFKKGMAAISRGRFATDQDLSFSESLIKNIGDYMIIEEKHQNIATALSGSGPAYFFLFCKYLIEAGVKNGLSMEMAKKLVAGTIIGSGITIKKSEVGLDSLIKMVASPGGTTEEALKEFDKNNLKKIVYHAVESARKRAEEIQKSMD